MHLRTEFDPLRLLDALHAGVERDCAFTATTAGAARAWQAHAAGRAHEELKSEILERLQAADTWASWIGPRRRCRPSWSRLSTAAPTSASGSCCAPGRMRPCRCTCWCRKASAGRRRARPGQRRPGGWPCTGTATACATSSGCGRTAPSAGNRTATTKTSGAPWPSAASWSGRRGRRHGPHRRAGSSVPRRSRHRAHPAGHPSHLSCFGERRADYSALAGELTGPTPATCHNASTYAIMLGGSVMGLRVYSPAQ